MVDVAVGRCDDDDDDDDDVIYCTVVGVELPTCM